MTLRLAIENFDRLADGGPLRVEVKGRGLDIGRDAHLDWTLPDPSRIVSGKHCEIRFRDNEYWLFDVSTNGTFVNGSGFRLEAPYRLRDRDRLVIGPYVVAVTLEGAAASPEPAAGQAEEVWGAVGDSAPPEARDAYRVRNKPAASGDFLDFATGEGAPPARGAPAAQDVWLSGSFPPPPESAPPASGELPRVSRPQPTRPALEPAPSPSVAVSAAATPEIAEPAPAPSPAAAAAVSTALLDRVAAAAGIPLTAIVGRDPGEVADEIGATLKVMVANLIQMAASRRQTKSAFRSAHHTTFRPSENNPLKFAASPEHAMETMFGSPSRIHLNAPAAVAEAFEEQKSHALLTFGAMQAALEALFEDLSPERIEAAHPQERGLGGVMASRKSRLWDAYAQRWQATTKRADGRLNDAFMALFAKAYDRLAEKRG